MFVQLILRNKIIKRLGDISTIQTGLFAKSNAKGDIVYLQAKHFNENGQLSTSLHPDLESWSISEKHLLKPGDVLFAAKGLKNFAAVYESHNPPSVASTSFFVIRLRDNNVLPQFLAWHLNHPVAQKFLKAGAIGSSIPSISKAVLESLEIPIPSMETQEAILKVTSLRKLELSIKKQMEDLQEKYIQNVLIKSIQQ